MIRRSRSAGVSADEGALELLPTWRPSSDDQLGRSGGVVPARRSAWRRYLESKQLSAAPRPTVQTAPTLWLRQAHDGPRTDARSHLGRAQHRHRPPGERQRDRAQSVAKVSEYAARRDGRHGGAIDAAVAPQRHVPECRARVHRPASPERPGSTPVPMEAQSPLFLSRGALATGAVRRSRLLDVWVVDRPIVDVEIMMRQLRYRSGFQFTRSAGTTRGR